MKFEKLQKYFSEILPKLPDELAAVLVLRYGLNGEDRHSLGKISRRIGRSKNAAGKMEIQGIRKLRHPSLCKPLFKLLDSVDDIAWSAISTQISAAGSLVFKKERFETISAKLHGEIELSMKCKHGEVVNWIRENTTEVDSAWFRSRYPDLVIREALDTLTSCFEKSPLIIPESAMLEKINGDHDLLLFVMALSAFDMGIYRGYVALRPLSSYALRAIRIHLLHLYKYTCAPVNLKTITDDYSSIYSDDELTSDVASDIMRSSPHLFRPFGDGNWIIAGPSNVHPRITDSKGAADSEYENHTSPVYMFERPWSETTAVDIINEILEGMDLAREVDIIRIFMLRTEGRYHDANVSGALMRNGSFLQVAPGFYALRKKYDPIDSTTASSDRLLTRRACRSFIIYRYAGEPMNFYPLWTAAMEQKWCYWAESNSDRNTGIGFGKKSDRSYNRKIFESLMYVVDPDQWQISDEQKRIWKFKKQCHANYHFQSDWDQADWMHAPTLQNLFSVAVTAKRVGYMNWVRASLVSGFARQSVKSAGTLILLIAMGALQPAEHWQKRHESGEGMDDVLHIVINEIKKKGFVHWRDEAGKKLKHRIRENFTGETKGWAAIAHVTKLLAIIEGKTALGVLQSEKEPKDSMDDEKRVTVRAPKQLQLSF